MSGIHDQLERSRKPRVHIKYEVETENGKIEKELPFVVGVLGDFSGDHTEGRKSLKDRKFITVDQDNFNEVMARILPKLDLSVENLLSKTGEKLGVHLEMRSLQDFEPAQIVAQVPLLQNLRDLRDRLRDLLTKSDRSEKLEALLEQVLQNPQELEQLNILLGENS